MPLLRAAIDEVPVCRIYILREILAEQLLNVGPRPSRILKRHFLGLCWIARFGSVYPARLPAETVK